jgi:hypothetical protein
VELSSGFLQEGSSLGGYRAAVGPTPYVHIHGHPKLGAKQIVNSWGGYAGFRQETEHSSFGAGFQREGNMVIGANDQLGDI